MLKICVRCGHNNPKATGADDEACPSCGAIYSKARPVPRGGALTLPAYVEALRAQTLYPTFRGVTGILHWVIWFTTIMIALLSIVMATFGEFRLAAGSLVLTLLFWVFSRAAKEGALMLADLADAMVRLAASRDA